mmetsp:Transcript_32981/g.60399  ORF Transcript_32981/g.60399 Transcript_32981/m.60399 type:complete len:256 (-) Transcript_32981:317-1084(-)
MAECVLGALRFLAATWGSPLQLRSRGLTLRLVLNNWEALALAAVELRQDREIVLAAVAQNGKALGYAASELQRDREIVLAAVSQNGEALACAASELKCDREIVLAAVSQCGEALRHAAPALKNDRRIILAALKTQGWTVTRSESDVATGVSRYYLARSKKLPRVAACEKDLQGATYMLEVVLLSGRSCCIHVDANSSWRDPKKVILLECGRQLGLNLRGDEALVHGSSMVDAETPLSEWPGAPTPGKVTEYQLVL